MKILIFDYLIGNTDRHQNNLAVRKNKKGELEFAPLYDNGSSLCFLISDEVSKILNKGKDQKRIESVIVTKSKSMVRINGKIKAKPMHIEVMQYLRRNYDEQTHLFVNKVINRLSTKKIQELVEQVRVYITEERANVLQLFLNRKVEDLKKIYSGEVKK